MVGMSSLVHGNNDRSRGFATGLVIIVYLVWNGEKFGLLKRASILGKAVLARYHVLLTVFNAWLCQLQKRLEWEAPFTFLCRSYSYPRQATLDLAFHFLEAYRTYVRCIGI